MKITSEVLRSTNEYVIRFKVDRLSDCSKLRLFIHKVVDGNEMQPRGYMVGSNYLSFEFPLLKGESK